MRLIRDTGTVGYRMDGPGRVNRGPDRRPGGTRNVQSILPFLGLRGQLYRYVWIKSFHLDCDLRIISTISRTAPAPPGSLAT